VALFVDGALVAERELAGGRQQHAASLLGAIDELLPDGIASVEGLALSVGPGSFTGLRIGLATALGLCFGSKRWIVPVPTLAALATRAQGDEPVIPMLDARKGEIYTGLYTADGRVLQPDRSVGPAEWLASLGPGSYSVLGSGVGVCRDVITRILGDRARVLAPEQGRPSASAVGRLGLRLAAQGDRCAPGDVQLRYVRLSEAEQKRRALPSGSAGVS
jgi:tRNA threonylcarbamoyladenosine biosynthesis protein TsaB